MKRVNIVVLERLLSEGKMKQARRVLSQLDKGVIVILLDQAADEYKPEMFALLDNEVASDVILEVSEHTRNVILSTLTRHRISRLFEDMESDDSTDLVLSLPEKLVRPVLNYLTKKERDRIQKLIGYEEDTAGGLMQVETVLIRELSLIHI